MPTEFIPIAEDTGQIIPIGYWILEQACVQALKWQAKNSSEEFCMSVNLSGKQLQRDDVVQRVADILLKTGLPPACLKLEITESVLMTNREDVVDKMHRLKEIGVKLALDDFGTGYSSLSTLSLFPIDTLKIDRAFIGGLGDREDAAAIVEAIMALSKTMKMNVVGEGVETKAQLDTIRALGCHSGQGFWFDEPLSVLDFDEKLAEASEKPVPTKTKAGKKAKRVA